MKENENVVFMKEYSNNTLLYGDINLLIFYFIIGCQKVHRQDPYRLEREEKRSRQGSLEKEEVHPKGSQI